MKPLNIQKNTSIVLGAPAKPMPQTLLNAIGEMIRGVEGIREAYLPRCYVKDIVDPPAQVLVLVLDGAIAQPSVLDAVGKGLSRILPQEFHLDVWPLYDGDGLLDTVRGTRMQVCGSQPAIKKPWWKIFG